MPTMRAHSVAVLPRPRLLARPAHTLALALALLIAFSLAPPPARAGEIPARMLSPWQVEAAYRVRRLSAHVLYVQWPEDGVLWVAVRRNATDWVATTRFVCVALDKAGRPPEALVAVIYLDADHMPTFRSFARATCEARVPSSGHATGTP